MTVQDYIKTCPECQLQQSDQIEEALYPTFTSAMWEKIRLDVIYILADADKKYIVTARNNLSE
jgi:hypothetical protein